MKCCQILLGHFYFSKGYPSYTVELFSMSQGNQVLDSSLDLTHQQSQKTMVAWVLVLAAMLRIHAWNFPFVKTAITL